MRPIMLSQYFFRLPLCISSVRPGIHLPRLARYPSAHPIAHVHYNARRPNSPREPPILHGEIEYPKDSAIHSNIESLRRSLARIQSSTTSLQSEYTPLSTRKIVEALESDTKSAQIALYNIEKEAGTICRQRDVLEKERSRDAFSTNMDKQARMTMTLVTWFFIATLGIMFLDEIIELAEIFSGRDPERRRVRRVVIEPGDHRADHSDLWRWFLEE